MPSAMPTCRCCWRIEMAISVAGSRNLVFIRHGESATNAANVFTGWSDPPLTRKGEEEARRVARRLSQAGLRPDRTFTSVLQRAGATAAILLDVLDARVLQPITSAALNERDYGALTGLNKKEAADRWGIAQVREWRRSYEVGPPGGESLRDTAARVLAYYVRTLLPSVMAGGTTFVVSHGNTLRALIMALDGMTAGQVADLELATGATHVFILGDDTSVVRREILPVSRRSNHGHQQAQPRPQSAVGRQRTDRNPPRLDRTRQI